ncbi:GatB/YqeY domain-containing protein [Alicyclobacillus sp. ALC3]|uniref:GatB/YqeY domain-containing protein n=1 Tax=Alicyclobacillus sp. ALC3 TaxID=2796143 RepID=UPI002378D1B7|nr:GatB/YqeY domain-containing protein [Alicyclobacillus sp. ALC3]WDL96337.1 GatB/YqeY domain-containing protein [Alicyclobacillus sp. ALC3]
MGTLSERLSDDMKQAMKDKEKVRLSVIRMVRAAIRNKEIDSGASLNDEEVLAVVQKELKQRRDSLQAFENAGRADLADAAKEEIRILETYLPAQLSEEEVRTIAVRIISEVGASGKSDVGKVMPKLMQEIRGKADGKLAQQVVSGLLP